MSNDWRSTTTRKSNHAHHREGDTQVLLRPILLDALQRLNGITEQDAREAYTDLLTKTDNSEWTAILRGDYSRPVAGSATRKTIRVVDLLNPANNTFTVASQFYVRSQAPRKPDIVVFVNGIPLVVIECKSPLSAKDKTGEAFEQIKQYERDIPRLFFSNAFNIVTNGHICSTAQPPRHRPSGLPGKIPSRALGPNSKAMQLLRAFGHCSNPNASSTFSPISSSSSRLPMVSSRRSAVTNSSAL
jgi:type I site-specific restriction-modification system R (restriction) subunit